MSGRLKDIAKLVGFGLVALAVIYVFRDDVLRGLALLRHAADSPWALPIAFAFFLCGSLIFVPQSILIASAIAAFGLLQGGVLAWVCISAVVCLEVFTASQLRGRLSHRLASRRMQTFRGLLTRNSFTAGILVRIIPTGPFLLVNIAAGLAGVRLGPFMAGTLIGTLPKIVLIGLITQGLVSTAQEQQIGLVVTLIGLALLGVFGLARRGQRLKKVKASEIAANLAPDGTKSLQ